MSRVHALRASNDSGDAIVATASERLFYAVLFAIVEDGLVASSTSLRAHAGAVTSLLAGLEASCFMALPLALAAAPVAWLLDRPTSRVLGRHLRAGLAAGEPENEGTGVVLYSLALAVGAVLTWQLGMRIGELQSTRVATLATLAVALFAMGASALVSTLLVGRAGKLLHRLPARLRAPPPWLPVPGVLVTLAGVAALYWFLPSSHAITPAAALVGFFLGPEIGSRIVEGPARVRAPVALLFGASVLLTAGASIALPRLPDAAKLGVLTRAPYASLLITTIRRLFDRDHDGYSPILGGGDCNDHDPAIHPHALDLPGNGIDENCSGADAHPFVPQPQPPASVPPIAGAPRRYNVVLVHVEAVRPDHMSMNGYRRPTTPRIDRFKEGAVWFRNAYSTAPSTRFALSQIFTGLEVPRIPQKRGSGVDYWLLPEATTLAERLAPAGYDTVGYTLSYVLQHIHDVGQGFREWTTPWRVDEWKETYHDASELTTNAALEYLKATPQDGTKPYLLFLHYGATHDPYIKHGENAAWDYGDEPIDLYDSALNYEDAQLGRLFDALDARADRDRTVVLVYSDHGELFGEHGFTKHGNTLYQPDVRVMLLAKMPGAAPRAIDAPTALSDLSATILHLTGLPPDPKSQAWDLVPYMQGAPMPSRTLFFYGDLWRSGVHFENRAVLLPDSKTKFIRDVSNDQNMLFDLARDPGELTSIAGSQPALASKMSEEQDSWEAFESAGMSWEDSHAAKGGKGGEREREGEEKDRNPGD